MTRYRQTKLERDAGEQRRSRRLDAIAEFDRLCEQYEHQDDPSRRPFVLDVWAQEAMTAMQMALEFLIAQGMTERS